jgi:gas vesicle protein
MGKLNNSTGKVVGGLLVGAAIGGALAILFAPNKGSVTRKKLYSKGGEFKDTLQAKYDALLKSQKNNKEKSKS